jgi:hypothetical protein
VAESKVKARVLLGSAVIIVGLVIAAIFAGQQPGYVVTDRDKVGMPRLLNQAEAHLSDLPSLVDAMSRGSASVRYATLIFNTPDRPSEDDALNIQISLDNGKIGFDWVLLGQRNIEDREKFMTFARTQGVEPVARSMNGVSYLRVEGTDIAKFTANVVTGMYHRPSNDPLGLVYEGFAWPQS